MRETGIRLPRRAESPEPPPSVDEQLERLGFGRFQWIALVAFVCFIVADGMELVVTNIIWSVLPLEDWGAPDFYRATLVSVSFLGFVFGALLGGFAGDVYGRLWLIYGHSIIFIPTSILSALSQSIAMLLVTRFFVGFSIGLVLPAVVSMMSEICPASHRGRAVLAIPGISYTVGQVAILLSGIYFISLYGFDCTGCEWWRWMLVAGVIPDAVGVCIVLAFVPESPRFLLYQGRLDRVQEVLQLIARTNDKESNLKHDGACRALPDDEEFCDVFKSAEAYAPKLRVGELLQEPLVRTMPLAVTAWCFLSVTLYAQVFLWPIYVETLGYDRVTQYYCMILVALVEIPGLCLCILFILMIVDRKEEDGTSLMISRRLLLFALAVFAAVWVFLCIFIAPLGPTWAVLGNAGMRLLAVMPYEMMYVYVAELLPTSHRAAGLALANSASKFVACIIPPVMLSLMLIDRAAPFVLVCVCASLAALLAWVSPDVEIQLHDSAAEIQRRHWVGLLPSQTCNIQTTSTEESPLVQKRK